MAGDDKDASPAWVPYAQRPEWADVTPPPLGAATGQGVVAIQYDERAREVLGYFRAVVAKGERSERVLRLTEDVICVNSADYTAWQWRWEALLALGADLRREYDFTAKVARECAKNYQLWNHRRKLARALGPGAADAELQFCAEALQADAKNYHAWAHRQAVVAAAGAWEQELAYVDALLQEDVRNNSAWSQRAFVLQHTLAQRAASLQQLLDDELGYVAAALQRAPGNESAWNYLAGLFSLPGCPPHELGRQDKVLTICREALADCPSCKPALDVLALFYEALAAGAPHGSAAAAAAVRHGLAALDKAALADPMRRNYWSWRREQLVALAA